MATAREIAEAIDLKGLTRVAAIQDAGPDAVVFATEGAVLQAAVASQAGMILASQGIAGDEFRGGRRIVWVKDARYAFAIVARRLTTAGAVEFDGEPDVADSARVGEGTRIAAGARIGEGVRLGRMCQIGPNVTIYPGARLGDRVVVQAGAVLGSKGFGYVRDPDGETYLLAPQQGGLTIEDDVEIGANTTIDRGALGETRIGAGTKIDNLVHIGHNCRIGRNVMIAAQTGISGSSVVEDGAILGGQVGIGDHALVGAGVILGGGAGVLTGKKLRGPGAIFWGRPARPLKEYLRDLARLKRR